MRQYNSRLLYFYYLSTSCELKEPETWNQHQRDSDEMFVSPPPCIKNECALSWNKQVHLCHGPSFNSLLGIDGANAVAALFPASLQSTAWAALLCFSPSPGRRRRSVCRCHASGTLPSYRNPNLMAACVRQDAEVPTSREADPQPLSARHSVQ